MMQSSVILVDKNDRPCGTESKQLAHTQPLLHRAYSILLFRPSGEIILQRRAQGKYHSGGLWSNACCSHPPPGTESDLSATLRLRQEMGIEADLQQIGTLHYELELADGLFEYEFNHVFCGISDLQPAPDPAEVSEWQTASLSEVVAAARTNPQKFTAWFPLILQQLKIPIQNFLRQNSSST